MKFEDFDRGIRTIIRAVWKDMLLAKAETKIWFETFRNYDLGTVEAAVKEYIRHNKYRPTPADIFDFIPAAEPKSGATEFTPRYETMPDGTRQRVVQCLKCRDTGLIVWEDKDGYRYGKPCTCQAAIANYGSKIREKAYA